MSRLTRDGTVETVSRDQILRYEHEQGKNFPVQLTTSRIGNLTRLIHTVVVASEGFRRNSAEIRYVVRATLLSSAKLCNDGGCLWSTKIS